MSDIALGVEGLGKRYRLGTQDDTSSGMYRYKSLRDRRGSSTRPSLRTMSKWSVAGPIDFFRWCLLGTPAHPAMWLVGAISTLATLLLGLAYFRRVEDTFADVV